MAAASIATYAVEREYVVGLYTNDMRVTERGKITVPPSRGREHLADLLGAMATVSELAAGPMAEQLAEHSKRFPFGSTVVLCASFIPQALSETISELKGRGHKIVVLYVGKEEQQARLPDGIVVYDLSQRFEQLEWGK